MIQKNPFTTLTVPTPTSIAEEQRVRNERQDALESARHEEFVEDFERSTQCARATEAQVLYLKHKVIPEAIAEGKKETPFTIDPLRFFSPWIANDTIRRKLALECVVRCIRRAMPIEYTVVFFPFDGSIRVGWQ